MATKAEFDAAFAEASERCIIVQSKSGKLYYMHEDNLPYVPNGLIYGVPVNKNPRAKRDIFWMRPENVTIKGE